MAKLTKDELYWQKRNEELEAEWFRRSQKEIERELAAYYTQALKHIEKDINDLYARFAIDNSMSMTAAYSLLQGDEFRVWRMDMQEYLKQIEATGDKKLLRELNTLAMRSRISRLDKLYAETCVELSKLAEKFGRSMDKFLPTAYKDFYYRNLFEIGRKRGLASTPAKVESNKLENVLRAPWSGKNYSARIWANQEKLAEILQREITAAMHRGASVENVSKIITQKMGVGMSDARRLVRTELNYVQNRAALDSIKDAGMKYYRFVATLDRRTSAACRTHDGKIYPVDEGSPGTNMPPLHPHCRSTIAGSVKGDGKVDGGKRVARQDGKLVKIPANVKYADWLKSLDSAENRFANNEKYGIMKLPNYENAVIPDAKLSGYALNHEHPKGRDKARVFKSALGFSADDADILAREIRKGLEGSQAVKKSSDKWGSRYEVPMSITGTNGKTARVITAWIIGDDKVPRLTSAYVKN